jgi:transcriptional regulator with XRE-family HTH domain
MMPLRKLRLTRKLTLSCVAKAIGIDVANLSRIERKIQNPSIITARKIATFYGVTIDAVLGDAEEYKKAG